MVHTDEESNDGDEEDSGDEGGERAEDLQLPGNCNPFALERVPDVQGIENDKAEHEGSPIEEYNVGGRSFQEFEVSEEVEELQEFLN